MRSHVRWLLLYGALLFGVTVGMQRVSAHSTSRLDTIAALVEHGTFAIDSAPYVTSDKVLIEGHFYSHQPPLQAIAGAVVYYPIHLAGMRLGRNRMADALVTFAVNGLVTMGGLVFFFRTLRWSKVPAELHLPVTASLACGTLILPFSTTMNGHGFSAALMTVGLYYYLRCIDGDPPKSLPAARTRGNAAAAFCSGLAFSLCAAGDHAMTVFYAVFAACLWLRAERRGDVVWFLLPAFFTLAPAFAYYYAVGHSIKPFAARPELFVYPGSVWSATGPIDFRLTGAVLNSPAFALRYGTGLLTGPHGFLIYNPAAFLALHGIGRAIRRKTAYWREAGAVLAGCLTVVVYYALVSANDSGRTYSIRWFIPFLPLWWFFGTPAIEDLTQRKRWLAGGLCAVSVFYAFAGALNPWPSPYFGYGTPIANIREELGRPHFGYYLPGQEPRH